MRSFANRALYRREWHHKWDGTAAIVADMMNKLPTVVAFMALLSACAAKPKAYELWANEPTPPYWSAGLRWAFAAIGNGGRIERSLTLRFTDAAAEACASGDWKRVEVIAQSPPRSPEFVGEAAYLLNGRALIIDLTANICDNYTEYRGELTENGFVGTQSVGHMFGGEDVGPVYGVPWSR